MVNGEQQFLLFTIYYLPLTSLQLCFPWPSLLAAICCSRLTSAAELFFNIYFKIRLSDNV